MGSRVGKTKGTTSASKATGRRQILLFVRNRLIGDNELRKCISQPKRVTCLVGSCRCKETFAKARSGLRALRHMQVQVGSILTAGALVIIRNNNLKAARFVLDECEVAYTSRVFSFEPRNNGIIILQQSFAEHEKQPCAPSRYTGICKIYKDINPINEPCSTCHGFTTIDLRWWRSPQMVH